MLQGHSEIGQPDGGTHELMFILQPCRSETIVAGKRVGAVTTVVSLITTTTQRIENGMLGADGRVLYSYRNSSPRKADTKLCASPVSLNHNETIYT